MKILLILDFPSKTWCLTKFLFWSYCPKCSWAIRLQNSLKCDICKKIWEIKLIFCMQVNIRVSYKFVLLVLMGMPRVPKTTSLQYHWNIPRNRWGINIIFCMNINIKVFYKLVVFFLLALARHIQNTQNSKFVISLQCFNKEGKDEVYFFACR